MHILIASDSDCNAVLELGPDDTLVWVVPKSAEADDVCVLSHARIGLFAYGSLQADAAPDAEVARQYRAPLGQIETLRQLIPHSFLARLWPS